MRRVRGKHSLDSAIFFSSRDLRGTVDDGEYFFRIYRVLNGLYLVIADTEYGVIIGEPFRIATIYYDSFIFDELEVGPIMELLKWSYDVEDY
jgi:hypothetical protein|tara:strand:+ start:258 stop:533 length:276 start_codon:yes stop_codon:yes gene_type:complete